MISLDITSRNITHSLSGKYKVVKDFVYLSEDNTEKNYICPNKYDVMLEVDKNNVGSRISVYENGAFDGLRIDINANDEDEYKKLEKIAMTYAKIYIEQRKDGIIKN